MVLAAGLAVGAPVKCVAVKQTRRSRAAVSLHAVKGANTAGPNGYIQEDNSGRGNIFPVTPRAYSKKGSVTEGLGGTPGLIVLAAVLGVVGLATVGVVTTESGVVDVAQFDGDSLTAIATRIQASL